MSDTSQGHGWWLASDGKWYPPQQPGEMHDFEDGSGPVQAHRHSNGGGWVADTAMVAHTAFVGPDAAIFGYAQVLDSASVTGTAWVLGAAVVSGSARIAGDAEIGEHARVSGSALVTDDARVAGDALVTGDTVVSGRSWVTDGTPKGPDWWLASDGNWYPPAQVTGNERPQVSATPGAQLGTASTGSPGSDLVDSGARWTNRFAIAALIGGGLCIIPVVGLFTAVLAIVFGVIALRQIKKSEGAQKGARLAIVGMAIAIPLFVVGAVIGASSGSTTTSAQNGAPSTVTTPPPTAPPTSAPAPTTQPTPAVITLTITGTGTATSISILDGTGETEHSDAPLPFTTTIPLSGTSLVGIDAQAGSGDPSTPISCEIDVPGQSPVTNTSTGAYALVDCNATVGF